MKAMQQTWLKIFKLRNNLMKRSLIAVMMVGVFTSTIFAGSALAASQPKIHHVHISKFKFNPAKIEVKKGDIIEFDNQDFAPHTATAKDKSFDTKYIKNKDTARISLDKAGTYEYACRYHPGMLGKIIVK